MKRVLISLLFTSVLFAGSGFCAKPRDSQTNDSRKQTLKEGVLAIQPGTLVEVRLKNHQKLRGRLGEISDDAFKIQTANKNTIETRAVAFDDLKSVKKAEVSKGAQTAGYIILGGLAGVGVLFLILFAAVA